MGKKGKKETKTEYVRNIETRDKFIEKFGKERFEELANIGAESPAHIPFSKYLDIPIPNGYNWIFNQFLCIWQGCEYDLNGNVIFTYQTINEYQKCMFVPFDVRDKRLLMMMKAWALNTIAELNKSKD